MAFDIHIGIDYSGAATPTSRTASLQVYAVTMGQEPDRARTPIAPEGQHWNWSRKEIAEWLIGLARSGRRFIAGIDHAFSSPVSYFERYKLKSWDQLLDDFCRHWPTDEPHTYVDFVRDRNPPRTGRGDDFRLVESVLTAFETAGIDGQVVEELWEYAYSRYDQYCKASDLAFTTSENIRLMRSHLLGPRRISRRRR